MDDTKRTGILLVDDRADKLAALEAALDELKLDVVQVRSGRDALRAVLARDVAVILLDIVMPGMDGFETAALLRQRKKSAQTPIIFVTSFNQSETDLARGYELSTFVDVINFFNQEQIFSYDEAYSFDNVNPIVGGEREDLIWAKAQGDSGGETNQPISRNIAYGTPTARYTPLFVRLGARLSF